MLKLNEDTTELLVFSSKQQVKKTENLRIKRDEKATKMKIPSTTLFVLVCVTWVGGEARMMLPDFLTDPVEETPSINYKEVDCSEIDVKTATLISADSCPSSGEGTVYFKYLITETDEYQKCGKRCPYVQRDNECLGIDKENTQVVEKSPCSKKCGIGIHLVTYMKRKTIPCKEYCCCKPCRNGGPQVPPPIPCNHSRVPEGEWAEVCPDN
ncbi:hypothetical protein LSH36_1115g00013 [Paralvinella palmiformis]|uniref:Uncharacterized protein n=1 Tax=Paralvinella palmiformis TaxID=53620 RepID=A0AAD9MRE9_9ANNE|nr:hypothetical protein LSH36_1115g00013 [Paralvinella palmiformis]